MDRGIVYPGSLPQDTDILNIQQRTMIAAGALLQATFGTGTFVDGLACTQTTVPSMSVTVGQGWIGSLTTVEPNAYGSLAADAVTPLMKMGINLQATNLGPMSAPGTAGQSVVYLVEAAFSETDTSAVVLPYYNSSNPSVPYSGPANAGTAQNTKRAQTVTLQLKQGTAATTGSQTTPAPDSGFTGLYAITIANGASSIINANIAKVSGAPFLDPLSAGRGIRTGRLINVQVFVSSGTYTPTLGMAYCEIECVGAGGAGAGSGAQGAGTSFVAGGGGSGAYALGRYSAATIGSSQTVTIGTAGTCTAGANAGGNGGASSVGSIISSPGGGGAPVGNSVATTSSGFATPGSGASSPSGWNIVGTPGGQGVPGLTILGQNSSGAGAASQRGAGGGGVGNNTAGNVGYYGGGGSGACTAASGSALAGGNGGGGIVVIREFA